MEQGEVVLNESQDESCSEMDQSTSYFDCGIDTSAVTELLSPQKHEEDEEEGLNDPTTLSDLSDPSRNMWIVTTAALPWRTGTSVNPFLRALYFVRRRLHLYRTSATSSDDDDNEISEIKPGKITLVIPWLVDQKDAEKLLGGHITKCGEEGKAQQLQWIEEYASEKCGMKDEMKHLHILFYDAAYWSAFGSIFPTVDICNLIPTDEADIAILEEPEHLNWMRVPDLDHTASPASYCGTQNDVFEGTEDKQSQESAAVTDKETLVTTNDNSITTAEKKEVSDVEVSDVEVSDSNEESESEQKLSELGWAHKFSFVVGIIHTNYSAYMKQYGIGTTIVGAPVINAISSMVVRAYCHKVVRLSGVIPSYAKWKEVTCNVHGVRCDFLDNSDLKEVSVNEEKSGDDESSAAIYFIGKLLWAKGLDRLLKVEDCYRRKHPDNEYFRIDIYGGGPDELEIKRAFLGRKLQAALSNQSESESEIDNTEVIPSGHESETQEEEEEAGTSIFSTPRSLRSELLKLTKSYTDEVPEAYKNAKNYINAGFEIVPALKDGWQSPCDNVVMERRQLVGVYKKDDKSVKPNPISILSDVSGKSINTGIATTKAVKNLADSALKAGLAMTFTQDEEGERCEVKQQAAYRFDPPKTIYELRRTSIPARFLGVKDHALLRNVPHKIFLNPSITEVLCTTTAEALAMGKFVIIPNHVSNKFFLQFSNCLAYDTEEECVEKIQWAIQNDPVPLSDEEAHIFTWDAATDRMIKASVITKREAKDRSRKGFDKADSRMAWIHSEGGKKGSFIKSTFFGQTIERKTGTSHRGEVNESIES